MTIERHTIHDEDAEYVIAWRQGEITAFEELVRKYQKRIFTIAYRCIGNYEDACDVTQDAFIAAFRGVDTFRGAARFSTWLTGITVKLSRNRLQHSPSGQSTEAPASAPRARGIHGSLRGKLPSPATSTPDQFEWLDLSGKLQGCISSLDADSREMIVLRDVQRCSYDEICAILSIREGSVKSRLSLARELMKDCLKRSTGAQ